ncbi:hypothetical protein F7725_018713 [Dissostichus mawsoni]|uniref:Uncharacterized protein n=1 Tax=Dissostichus mawsoni TaxID=36200 RepID=A0A7J5XS85_DISMA|nr:hypothetical protein F7725_018713 [Dissostichus mawsoni]
MDKSDSLLTPVFLQRRLQPLAAHRLQQQLRPLRGAEDARLYGRALGVFRWQVESSGGPEVPALQMMGSGLLAEMKAKQERRAYKSSSPDRPESNATVAKPQPTNSESRSSSGSNNKPDSPTGSPEKTSPRAENKPDRAPRGPVSTKPPVPQGAKPALAARPTIPQKPRTSSTSRSIDDISDLPSSGPGSPKVSVLPSTLKKTVSEKEKKARPVCMRKGSVSDSLQRPGRLRVNSEDHGSFNTKDQCPKQDKDKAAGNKSSDSGEEADKDFILI